MENPKIGEWAMTVDGNWGVKVSEGMALNPNTGAIGPCFSGGLCGSDDDDEDEDEE